MLNQCQFIGNVGKDPEIKTMNDGAKMARFSLGVSERWKDKNSGEAKEKTEWVNVVVWGPLAGVVEQYVGKGQQIYVQGKMQTRKWQAQDGTDRYSTEIVLQGFDAKLQMLGRKPDGAAKASNSDPGDYAPRQQSAPAQQKSGTGAQPRSTGKFLDDEIPF